MASDDREKRIEQLKKLLETFADPGDGTIYHYTSAPGFQGIIENRELWLTNTEFVNDITECKMLQEEAKNGLFNEEELSFNKYLKERWKDFICGKESNNYYIASFSKESDSLEQWRAYGSFCIGFDVQKLRKDNFRLYECVYDNGAIKKWMLDKAKVEEWRLDDPDHTKTVEKNGITRGSCDNRYMAASELIASAKIKFKHPCYINEKEVRLFAVSYSNWDYPKSPGLYKRDPAIHFRSHPAYKLPVPYVKFIVPERGAESDSQDDYEGKAEYQVKTEKHGKEKNQKRAILPIKVVWIGPGPHQDKMKLASEILLREKGYKDVQVESSKIPYRGF